MPEPFNNRVVKTERCWLYTGPIQPNGYGKYGNEYAHRYVYRHTYGPVPKGLEVGHVCDVRNCVNPAHLIAQTHAENMGQIRRHSRGGNQFSRATHCQRGHEFTPENSYTYHGRQGKECLTCSRARAARNQRKYRVARRVP